MNRRKAPTLTDVPPLLLTVQQAAAALGVGKDMVTSKQQHAQSS